MRVKVPKHNDQPVNQEQRQELLDAARHYLGTPWQHMGRNHYGLDCAGGLILPIYDVFGAWIEVSDYSPWPSPATMREICGKILLRASIREICAGDVVLLYVKGIGVCHMGWYAGTTLIHASNEAHARKMIETSIHSDWNLRGAFSVPQFVGG